MPKSLAARRFAEAFEPSVLRNSRTCSLADHCMYCSEKSASVTPALMYRFSMSAVVAKIEHTPRRPWLLTGDCSRTSSKNCRG
jgi:hypothetical protein